MSTIATLEKLVTDTKRLVETLSDFPKFVRRDKCGAVVNQAKAMAKDLGIEYTPEFGEAYNKRTWELRLTLLRYLAGQLKKATDINFPEMWQHLLDKPCPRLDELSPGGKNAA